MLIDSAVPLLSFAGRKIIGAIPVFKNTIGNSFFRNGFIVISIIALCKSIYDIFFSDVLTTGEKTEIIVKKALSVGVDIVCAGIGQTLGLEIALCLGFVMGPGALLIGGLTGLAIGYIGGRITKKIKEKEEKRQLLFYSDSLYFKYIPRKFREYAIPTMKWKDPPLETKSFAIELIINEDGKKPS